MSRKKMLRLPGCSVLEGTEVHCYYKATMKTWLKCPSACKYSFSQGDWIHGEDEDLFGISAPKV